jgi:iron(III) transport system permease protein
VVERQRVIQPVYGLVIPWGLFTLVIYGMIMIGGFVQSWGLNNA